MNTTRAQFRGSQRHMLDLVSHANYATLMNGLLAGFAKLTETESRVPTGFTAPGERSLPRFLDAHSREWFDAQRVKQWWLPGGSAKGATWDLISTCTAGERRGLLLVEAKAHKSELRSGGKKPRTEENDRSKLNTTHIASALHEANCGLRALLGDDVNLRIDSHYQLANRLAWAWKLADCGVLVVLLYLGFTGDIYFTDHFKDGDHWQSRMEAYLKGSVPLDLPGRVVPVGSTGSFVLLVKSMVLTAWSV